MTETLVLERLTPIGEPDYEAQTMPPYRNEVTDEIGDLAVLSAKPGTTWLASWIPGKPWLARLPDGHTIALRYEAPKELQNRHDRRAEEHAKRIKTRTLRVKH